MTPEEREDLFTDVALNPALGIQWLEERDRARATAMRLEQELARVIDPCPLDGFKWE